MTLRTDDPRSVLETRVVHDAQRRATTLLADAVADRAAEPAVVADLGEMVVAALRHHHESEDHDLWPMLLAVAPSLAEQLAGLTSEHDRLDDALDRLDGEITPSSTVAVRDLVHEHLAHEEPVLFPALRAHLPDDEWAAFSRRIVAGAPQVGTHLLVELFHEVSTDGEADLILSHLPPEAQARVPAMREEARRALIALRGS